MSEQDKEQSFEDAFNELATEPESADPIPDEPEPEDTGKSGASEVDDRDDSGDAAEPDEQPRDDQGRFTKPDDELERYKREAQQWQHRYNSDLGRQNALQRQIKERDQLIAQLQQKAAQRPNPEGSGVSDKEWNNLKEDFPEIAAAMEARLGSVASTYEQRIAEQNAQIQRLQQEIQPIQQQAQQQYVNAQYQILEQQHPDWKDVAGSTDFQSWLKTQPSTVQQLTDSQDAADAAYLISTYKLSTQPASDEIRQRRQRQLQQGKTLSNRGGRPTSTLPAADDFSAAFDYYAKR